MQDPNSNHQLKRTRTLEQFPARCQGTVLGVVGFSSHSATQPLARFVAQVAGLRQAARAVTEPQGIPAVREGPGMAGRPCSAVPVPTVILVSAEPTSPN